MTIQRANRPVCQYDSSGKFIKKFFSLTEAAIATNTDISSISRCCSGKTKTANGFIWKFDNKHLKWKQFRRTTEMFLYDCDDFLINIQSNNIHH